MNLHIVRYDVLEAVCGRCATITVASMTEKKIREYYLIKKINESKLKTKF